MGVSRPILQSVELKDNLSFCHEMLTGLHPPNRDTISLKNLSQIFMMSKPFEPAATYLLFYLIVKRVSELLVCMTISQPFLECISFSFAKLILFWPHVAWCGRLMSFKTDTFVIL